ncbi:hypothetical protein GKC30_13450 [Pseudodesulfovibrio sp. F-1]|uniref:Uncharacterized protein n=1 Tax=Pseudodesulfovibrio alkaliphilus TaxID=2661613 RepID=A0A7K1KRQ5_9BACT|nr:hypothetical protein [Pseudodesulfovibrio alkaliphilus]MUM78640.1 hypothetical protein [Pseudodesulfovibrio alkaliphilus]
MDQASFLEKKSIEDFLSLTFFGKATDNHTMDVQWYARSLMGFNESFIRLNKELFRIEVTLEIVAEEEGSLRAILKFAGMAVAAVGLYASVTTIDTYHEYKPSNAIKSTYAYVINLFKESNGDSNLLEEKVTGSKLSDEEKRRLLKLIANLDFKLSLDDMTLFLEQSGFDEVQIDGGINAKAQITKFDRPYFKVHPEDLTTVEEYDDILTVVAIGNYQEWKFEGKETGRKFTAIILDNVFLHKIKQHPAKEIFKMRFAANIVKISTIKAGNRKPSPPTYEIDSLKVVNESLHLPMDE